MTHTRIPPHSASGKWPAGGWHFRLFVLLCFIIPATVSHAQQTVPPLDMQNATIREVLATIEKESSFVFLTADNINDDLNRKVSLRTFSQQSIGSILDRLFRNTGIAYSVNGNQVAVFRDKQRSGTQPSATVSGIVTDEEGEPLVGVVVQIKGTGKAVSSDVNGKYTINFQNGEGENTALVFQMIGMVSREMAVPSGASALNVTMRYDQTQIQDIVVQTGIFERDKVSFTGSIASFSNVELRNMGNQNVVKSLSTLDPSFVVTENSVMGSNPNTMPQIEIRGQGAATVNAIQDEFSSDPNMPLFVLNGVEVPISRIVDLDMNRVESITILKDAGSTAIYGSKGANGVVVIETVKPQPGVYRVYYGGDFQIDAPDLSVYNMMNAREKLEFERLSGKYKYRGADAIGSTAAGNGQKALDELYAYRLAEIERGVDTYWLSEPVRVGFTNAHSIRISGGTEEMAVEVGGKYKDNQGVMKGSSRRTWAGNIALNYRNRKLIVSDYLDVSGYKARNSPYGSFATWTNTSPYFRKYNDEGGVDKYLQELYGYGSYVPDSGRSTSSITANIPNPLYNARLNGKDEGQNVYLSNSLLAQYQVNDHLQLKGAVDLSLSQTQDVKFTPPEHTDFDNVQIYNKGTYSNRQAKSTSVRAYLNGVYGRTFNGLHSVYAGARGEIRSTVNNSLTTVAEGFPMGSNGTPNLANSYKTESRPGYYFGENRAASGLFSANYSYAKRYLLDFSFRIEGASTFGSNRVFQPFWSTGLGWNLDKEEFAKGWKDVETLKIRASVGTAGNQNIGRVASRTIYQDLVESNMFGQGSVIRELANPDLPWQVARDIGAGVDFRAFRGRLSLTVDVFHKVTDPMIINVPLAPSTGVGSYPMDIGHITNTGIEGIVSFSPIYRISEQIVWTIRLTGTHSKSVYGGLGSKLNELNETLRNGNTMRQYMDGASPNDIWAVRSKGIDPATGKEVFIRKDGKLDYNYDASQMVVVGSTRPDILGVIGTSLRYKNFYASLNFRYSIGSEVYNYALYNKVENISLSSLEKNQDKRALHDRWKEPGDVAEFRSIEIVNDSSPKTSRFVQKNNYLHAESVSVSYELNDNPWFKEKLGIRTLRIGLYMNDIFRLETSLIERSTDYPFARSVSLSINLSF